MSSNKTIAIEILKWFVLNVVAPFALPLLTALLWLIFYDFTLISLIKLLLYNGVYIFLVLTSLISLFPDYKVVHSNIVFTIFFWSILFFCSIFTTIIFGSFLDIIPKITNINAPKYVTLSIFTFAVYFKFQIERIKHSITRK